MVKVKICGLTNLDDALAAVEAGADALGFVFAPSPRRVDPETVRTVVHRLPPFVTTVGVFVDRSVEEINEIVDFCRLGAVQLHGAENETEASRIRAGVIRVVRMGGPDGFDENLRPGAALLLDAYHPELKGGTGLTFDWSLAADAARKRRIILAGGLTPENAAEAVRTVRPYAVDVSSGVEAEPGRKDHEKLERFIHAVKSVRRPA